MSADYRDPKRLWHIHKGEGPVLGLAVHAGHEIRPDLLPLMNIDEATRLREEDPYTDHWTLACHSQFLTRRSRFEVDLNRDPGSAICIQPEDCWNLDVWTRPVDETVILQSLAEHAAFYRRLHSLAADLHKRFGRFVVCDFHSYNHLRNGPNGAAADSATNPDINIGTGSMNRDLWGALVDRFIDDLRGFDFPDRSLDVRENVNFRGRYVAEYIHHYFPRTGCVLAIEVKKFFMNEWTGDVDAKLTNALLDAFRATIPGMLDVLEILE